MKNQNTRHTTGNNTPRGSYSNGIQMPQAKVCNYENHTPTRWSSKRLNTTEPSGRKPYHYDQKSYNQRNKADNTLVCRSRYNNGEDSTQPSSESGEINISNRRTIGYQRSAGNPNTSSVKDVALSNIESNNTFNGSRSAVSQSSKKHFIKLVYNLEIVTSESRPGDNFIMEALLKEALIVHNEIIRRINNGVDPYTIEVSSLKEIYYFTQKGRVQQLMVHYLKDLQISYLLQEAQNLYKKLILSRGIDASEMRLNYLSQIRFLNFRRLGQTHWIDFKNKQIRLLGMPVGLYVKGLELIESIPEIRIGGMRLLRKDEGFGLSLQLFIPEKVMEEFHRQCIASSMSVLSTDEKIENEEITPEEMNETLDNELLEALRDKYNRDKELDKYDPSPRFLKCLPGEEPMDELAY